MAQFILDTTGTVHGVPGVPAGQGTIKPVDLDWCDLDAFAQGYISALFLTEQSDFAEERQKRISRFADVGAQPLSPMKFHDLAPETLARIMKDCREFQTAAPHALGAHFPQRPLWPEGDEKHTRAGRDFWLTRNGHGAGFWDGSWPEPYASKLDQLARDAGPAEVYLGDDGKIYLT